jgi:hypothetical protein
MYIFKPEKTDTKWHLNNGGVEWKTICGKSLYPNSEQLKVGQGHKDCQPDPPRETLCPICFDFMPK